MYVSKNRWSSPKSITQKVFLIIGCRKCGLAYGDGWIITKWRSAQSINMKDTSTHILTEAMDTIHNMMLQLFSPI